MGDNISEIALPSELIIKLSAEIAEFGPEDNPRVVAFSILRMLGEHLGCRFKEAEQ